MEEEKNRYQEMDAQIESVQIEPNDGPARAIYNGLVLLRVIAAALVDIAYSQHVA